MSHKLGRVENAVANALISGPSRSFSVADLAKRAFPGLSKVERRHRVSVLRAAHKLAPRLGWSTVRPENGALKFEKRQTADARPLAGDDEIMSRRADHVMRFLKGVLDPVSVEKFVTELERTDLRLLRERL